MTEVQGDKNKSLECSIKSQLIPKEILIRLHFFGQVQERIPKPKHAQTLRFVNLIQD